MCDWLVKWQNVVFLAHVNRFKNEALIGGGREERKNFKPFISLNTIVYRSFPTVAKLLGKSQERYSIGDIA